MPGYYEAREELWDSIPGVEHLNEENGEYDDARNLFDNILYDVELRHIAPQDSEYWQDFLDFFGFENEGDVWDWDDFRAWYEAS